MERCVICLETFNAGRFARHCEYCNHALGHPKCIETLFHSENAKCPLCNKGLLHKPQTRRETKDQRWYDAVVDLSKAEDATEYIVKFNKILDEMMVEKDITKYKTPIKVIVVFNEMFEELVTSIIMTAEDKELAVANTNVLIGKIRTLANVFL